MANNLSSVCTSIAEAIRLRGGISSSMYPQQFNSYIDAIPSGIHYNSDISFFTKTLTTYSESWSGLTSIPASTFEGFGLLSAVSIPNVSTISNYAFRSCSILTSLYAPKAATIGSYTFIGCNNIVNAVLSSAMWSIGSYAFSGNSYMFSTMPYLYNASYIDTGAFDGCGISWSGYLSQLLNFYKREYYFGYGIFNGNNVRFLDSSINLSDNGYIGYTKSFYCPFSTSAAPELWPNLQTVNCSNVNLKLKSMVFNTLSLDYYNESTRVTLDQLSVQNFNFRLSFSQNSMRLILDFISNNIFNNVSISCTSYLTSLNFESAYNQLSLISQLPAKTIFIYGDISTTRSINCYFPFSNIGVFSIMLSSTEACSCYLYSTNNYFPTTIYTYFYSSLQNLYVSSYATIRFIGTNFGYLYVPEAFLESYLSQFSGGYYSSIYSKVRVWSV